MNMIPENPQESNFQWSDGGVRKVESDAQSTVTKFEGTIKVKNPLGAEVSKVVTLSLGTNRLAMLQKTLQNGQTLEDAVNSIIERSFIELKEFIPKRSTVEADIGIKGEVSVQLDGKEYTKKKVEKKLEKIGKDKHLNEAGQKRKHFLTSMNKCIDCLGEGLKGTFKTDESDKENVPTRTFAGPSTKPTNKQNDPEQETSDSEFIGPSKAPKKPISQKRELEEDAETLQKNSKSRKDKRSDWYTEHRDPIPVTRMHAALAKKFKGCTYDDIKQVVGTGKDAFTLKSDGKLTPGSKANEMLLEICTKYEDKFTEPTWKVYNRIADYLKDEGFVKDAIKWYNIALKKASDPKDKALVLFNLGRAYEESNQPKKADKCYKKSFKLDPASKYDVPEYVFINEDAKNVRDTASDRVGYVEPEGRRPTYNELEEEDRDLGGF